MHPAIALALLAIASLLAARLPRLALPPSVPEAALHAVLLFSIGVLLGPIAGILDRGMLSGGAITPLAALLVGWIGTREGARFAPRLFTRVRDPEWQRAGLVTLGMIAAVALPALLGARRNPRLAAWQPAGAVALALAAVGAATARRPRSRAAGVQMSALLVCALFSVLLIRPASHFSGWKGLVVWLVVNAAAIGTIGMCAALIPTRTTSARESALGVLAFSGLAAGVGLVTGFSPLLLCAGAAAVAVRRLDRAHRSRFRAIVMRPIPGLYGLVWVVLGLCAAVSSWWIVPAALALALLRATVWLAGHRLDSGLPTRYAPDAIAPVLGLNFVITGDPALALGGGVATTFVVLVIAGVAAAPWLERRDTPSARLTSDVVVTELRC